MERTAENEKELAGTLHLFCLEKLQENRGKPHWRETRINFLLADLVQELAELISAIDNNLPKAEVWREAADIANFAAMIADNYEDA